MLIIRLQRVGKRNEPTFRIVLTDSKNGPKSGKFLEILGSYDARDKNESKVNGDRVKELIAQGAQLSDTVRNFLITKGVIEGKKVNVLPKKSPIKKEGEEEVAEETSTPAESTESATEEAPAEPAVEEPAEAPAEETPAEEVKEEVAEEAPAEEEKKEETPAEEEKIVEESTPEETEEKPAE
jgi:small subunit ribosomal protein S16